MLQITNPTIEDQKRKKRNELFKFELFLGLALLLCLIMGIFALLIHLESRNKEKRIYIISYVSFGLFGLRLCFLIIKGLVIS